MLFLKIDVLFLIVPSARETLAPSVPEFYVPLAHTTVRYLGLSSPADLKEFGIFSPSDLVDFESRVCLTWNSTNLR
jgi:hypothetical protein